MYDRAANMTSRSVNTLSKLIGHHPPYVCKTRGHLTIGKSHPTFCSITWTIISYTKQMFNKNTNGKSKMDKVSEVLDRLSTNGDTITEDSYNKAVQNNKIISFYGDSVVV